MIEQQFMHVYYTTGLYGRRIRKTVPRGKLRPQGGEQTCELE